MIVMRCNNNNNYYYYAGRFRRRKLQFTGLQHNFIHLEIASGKQVIISYTVLLHALCCYNHHH